MRPLEIPIAALLLALSALALPSPPLESERGPHSHVNKGGRAAAIRARDNKANAFDPLRYFDVDDLDLTKYWPCWNNCYREKFRDAVNEIFETKKRPSEMPGEVCKTQCAHLIKLKRRETTSSSVDDDVKQQRGRKKPEMGKEDLFGLEERISLSTADLAKLGVAAAGVVVESLKRLRLPGLVLNRDMF